MVLVRANPNFPSLASRTDGWARCICAIARPNSLGSARPPSGRYSMTMNEPPCMPSPQWRTSGTRTAFAAYIARKPSASPRNIASDSRLDVFTKYSRSLPLTATRMNAAQPEPPMRELRSTGPTLALIHSSASWLIPITECPKRDLVGANTGAAPPRWRASAASEKQGSICKVVDGGERGGSLMERGGSLGERGVSQGSEGPRRVQFTPPCRTIIHRKHARASLLQRRRHGNAPDDDR
eukprot:scaffold10980_cov125-Isochrysis_galbana.AAC.11